MEDPLVVSMARLALEVMSAADSGQRLQRLIEKQREAEEAFRQKDYAAIKQFPPHPAATAISAFCRYLDGDGDVSPNAFWGLARLGQLLALFAEDWRGCETKLAKRLCDAGHFPSVVCELQAVEAFRHTGHQAVWLDPKRGAEGDVLVDDHVYVECHNYGVWQGVRVPERLASHLASVWLTALGKADRSACVVVTVAETLLGAHVQPLERAVADAIASGVCGEVRLPLEGHEATIIDAAPYGHLAPTEAMAALEAEWPQAAAGYKCGASRLDPSGQTVIRRVAIGSGKRDQTIVTAARAAVRKHDQLHRGSPGILYVRYDAPVRRQQALQPQVRAHVASAVLDALAHEGADRVSAVLWAFEFGTQWPKAGRLILDDDIDGSPTGRVWMLVRNPWASVTLPDGCWPGDTGPSH